MSGVQHQKVSDDDDDIRIDRWFKRHYPDVPFGQLQKWMRKGAVRLDGKRVKGNERIAGGQEIRVPPMGPVAEKKPRAEKPRLSQKEIDEVQSWVLHIDDDVIAINKPAGLPTQGGTGQTRHLDGMLDALRYDASYRPKLVHRLDKDTSGVLLLGRNPKAAAALAKSFQTKTTDKRYWALVMGLPQQEGRIILKMDKIAVKGHERMIATDDGKHSLTDYEVVDNAAQQAAWLTLKPHTGRTHQLRLHCAEMGHPIVGDGKYGGSESFLGGVISKKLHLHSRFVDFPHPAGGRMTISAPLPDHMQSSFDTLGFVENDYEDPDFEN